MPEKLEFPWEREMPHKCTTCDSNRFISGILLQNDSLKRENYELRAALDKAQTFVAERDYVDQYDYEPPRTVTKCADRAKRLKCLRLKATLDRVQGIARQLSREVRREFERGMNEGGR